MSWPFRSLVGKPRLPRALKDISPQMWESSHNIAMGGMLFMRPTIPDFHVECKMSDTLPKGYEPADVEAKWRKRWRDDKTFTPDPAKGGDPYCIVIPPPNVTGALHIGHALNLTLIDTLCRHYRQKGKNVLWIPGTAHAGIAAQNVVEKTLA